LSSRRVSQRPVRVGDVGVVMDLSIHDIDIVRFLLKEEPVEVYAIAGSLKHVYEDYAHLTLKLPSAVGFIESNWLTPYKVRKLVVTCTEGIATLDYISQQLTIEDSSGSFTPSFKWEEPLKIELQSFVSALLSNKEFEVSGVDGYRAVRIAEAALRSASQGSPVKVSFSI
ncbi:MAG: Gfo/Idh/MocA family oxidoreductase, partial [Candidatus Nezhaarchaeota archaeon]|nr:Gfo/Idh/MocA family oxidoreductase [Candidatus Nezhaarchaeota archaeon]